MNIIKSYKIFESEEDTSDKYDVIFNSICEDQPEYYNFNLCKYDVDDIKDLIEICEIPFEGDIIHSFSLVDKNDNIIGLVNKKNYQSDLYTRNKFTFGVIVNFPNTIMNIDTFDNSVLRLSEVNNKIKSLCKRLKDRYDFNIDVLCSLVNMQQPGRMSEYRFQYGIIITEKLPIPKEETKKIFLVSINDKVNIELSKAIKHIVNLYKKKGVMYPEIELGPDRSSSQLLIGCVTDEEIFNIATFDKVNMKLRIDEEEFDNSIDMMYGP